MYTCPGALKYLKIRENLDKIKVCINCFREAESGGVLSLSFCCHYEELYIPEINYTSSEIYYRKEGLGRNKTAFDVNFQCISG